MFGSTEAIQGIDALVVLRPTLAGGGYDMPRPFVRFILLFAVVALVTASCSKSSPSTSGGSPSPSPSEASASPSPSETESEGGTITVGSDTANNHGSKDVSVSSSEEVELDDFYFEPTVMTGTPGQELTLGLKNESKAGTIHNFTIDAQNIDQTVEAGK